MSSRARLDVALVLLLLPACTRYVVTERAFYEASTRAPLHRAGELAVEAMRASGGEPVYVRWGDLHRDRQGRLQVVNRLAFGAGAMLAPALGFIASAIVVRTSGCETFSCDLGNFYRAVGLGVAGGVCGLVALGLTVAAVRYGEVVPARTDTVYVGNDGAVHF